MTNPYQAGDAPTEAELIAAVNRGLADGSIVEFSSPIPGMSDELYREWLAEEADTSTDGWDLIDMSNSYEEDSEKIEEGNEAEYALALEQMEDAADATIWDEEE